MEIIREIQIPSNDRQIRISDYAGQKSIIGTVLVTDDDTLLLPMMACELKMHLKDFNVLSAENGREAIEIIESVPIHALITDLNMPEIDGYGLLAYVKERKPDMRVFAMTADYNSEVKNRLHGLGVEYCFEKPFNLKEAALRITAMGNGQGA